MNKINVCSPALIYLIFSLTQIIVDASKKLYNVALVKFVMMILFTLLLNILCERGLGVISWIIVFVPFVLMSVITSILLFVFGLDPSSGNIIKTNYLSSVDNDVYNLYDPRQRQHMKQNKPLHHPHGETAKAHPEAKHPHDKSPHPHDKHSVHHKKNTTPSPHHARPTHTKHHRADQSTHL